MKYELAKKLKDAGFPQNIDYGHSFYEEGEDVANPTLSELIEACDVELFGSLEPRAGISNGIGWVALPRFLDIENDMEANYSGTTPEEAVANLWLKLNSKDLR